MDRERKRRAQLKVDDPVWVFVTEFPGGKSRRALGWIKKEPEPDEFVVVLDNGNKTWPNRWSPTLQPLSLLELLAEATL